MSNRRMKLRAVPRGMWIGAALLAGSAVASAQSAPVQTPAPAADAATPAVQTPAAAAPAVQAAAPAQGGQIHGTVVAGTAGATGKAAGVALPGVAVTATNSLTGKKYATTTDVNGAYAMAIPRNGRYVVKVELAAFASTTSEVLVNASGENGGKPDQTADFGIQLQSRVAAAEAQQTAQASSLQRGLQSLNLSGGGSDVTDASAGGGTTGTALPTMAGISDSAGASADAVAVSGRSGETNGMANFSEDEIRSRIEDAVAQGRASGMIPQGVDPTNMIVSVLGGMMGGPGGGGPGGGGGRRGGGGGGGAFRNFNPAQPHGSFFYQADFSALDSAPWSVSLVPTTKPNYAKESFGASLAGSPYIPGLFKPDTKQFVFLNFSGQRNTTPEIFNGTVPTLAERGLVQNANGTFAQTDASFAGLLQNVNGSPQQVMLYDPITHALLPGNGTIVPAARISAQARAILDPVTGYYPLPNVVNSPNSIYNYQTVTTAGQNSANLNARYVRNFGQSAGNSPFGGGGRGGGGGGGGRGNGQNGQPPALRQNINAGFNYSHSASDNRNIFLPLGGASVSNGYNLSAGYTIGYGRLSNNASLTWNRSHSMTRNYFTNSPLNPAAQVGIPEPAQTAINLAHPNFYNGLPNLSITNFTSLTNTAASDNIGQTISFSDFVAYRHKKHNMRYGFDIRRVHADQLGGNNPLGTFTFSGYNTESTADQNANANGSTVQASSGTGFADLLLGNPQQSQIQAGLNKIYLRENVYDWYVQDDFRIKPNVTLNYGLRYEYFGPYSEKNGRLVNLTGVSEQTTSVGCVTPNRTTFTAANGAVVTCGVGPTNTLVHGDYDMYSPRFGFAWHPEKLKETVIRGGYGINFNTTQFNSFAKSLSYQQPFARTEKNTESTSTNGTGCNPTTLTLANGFGCSGKTFQNSYSVNPNYKLGYVQVYNLDIQRTLPLGIVLNVGYNGSHGNDLDITRAPNHTGTSVTTPQAVAFTYEDSLGYSSFNALTINARQRLEHGISLQATYQYAHSIDDVCNIGAASPVSCEQDDTRLYLEEANSVFDVRHRLTGNWVIELPFGPNRAFLNKGGKTAAVLDGFSVSGDFTFASGTYFTPQYTSSAAQISAGGTYTLRPDRVFSQPIVGSGTLRSFFNPAAFVGPASPTGYGTASRNSIEGPGTVKVDVSLLRTVKLGDTRSFEARMTASNAFNTVQYNGINTTLNSATFGQVTGAAAMRTILFVARYRF